MSVKPQKHRRNKYDALLVMAACLAAFVAVWYGLPFGTKPSSQPAENTVTIESIKEWQTFTGKVTRVLDGDTFDVRKGETMARVRVAAIDAPEKKQLFGLDSRKLTEDMCLDRTVTVRWKDYDKRYDRYIGYVNCPGNKDLGETLLKSGLAWHYRAYDKDEVLQGMEDEARKKHRGLWKDDKEAIAPWDFRHGKKVPFFK